MGKFYVGKRAFTDPGTDITVDLTKSWNTFSAAFDDSKEELAKAEGLERIEIFEAVAVLTKRTTVHEEVDPRYDLGPPRPPPPPPT